MKSVDEPAMGISEIVLNQTNREHPSFLITVRKDENLAEERNRINSNSLVKNVLMIFVDTLSRANSFRNLPKTMEWFDKFSEEKDENFESFQFFKYHAVAPLTIPNLW